MCYFLYVLPVVINVSDASMNLIIHKPLKKLDKVIKLNRFLLFPFVSKS